MTEANLAMEAEAASTWLGLESALPPAAIADLRVERVPVERLSAYHLAWAELCEHALEGNIFLEPGFALPLLGHVESRRSIEILLVWQRGKGSSADRMIGLFPVSPARIPLVGGIRGFRNKLVTLGTPLLDRENAQAAFSAMLDWLGGRFGRPVALCLTSVPAEGPFMRTVVAALAPARRVVVLASHERAVLRHSKEKLGNILSLASAKTRKERKRQRRRLADHGTRAYVSARSPEAVARAFEVFLQLEHKGWKGESGTALLADAKLAAFARDMTRDMAREGKCRIDGLEVNGQAVAIGVILTSAGCAHFWKTAFDEAVAPLSPGVQFAIDLAQAQSAERGIELTDSCAIPNHPMIDKLWPDRLAIVDVAIALKPGASTGLSLGLALERARRRARNWAKALRSAITRHRR